MLNVQEPPAQAGKSVVHRVDGNGLEFGWLFDQWKPGYAHGGSWLSLGAWEEGTDSFQLDVGICRGSLSSSEKWQVTSFKLLVKSEKFKV